MSGKRGLVNLLGGIEVSLRQRHAQGERDPRKLTGFDFMAVFAQGGLKPRDVPHKFWKRGERDGATTAEVSCPCEDKVELFVGEYPTKCGCGRWYFYDGTVVRSLVPPTR